MGSMQSMRDHIMNHRDPNPVYQRLLENPVVTPNGAVNSRRNKNEYSIFGVKKLR
jgi:hypothetical protein